MNLKSEIIRFSKEIGIDEVGFASADPFLKEKEILQERKRKQLLRCPDNKMHFRRGGVSCGNPTILTWKT